MVAAFVLGGCTSVSWTDAHGVRHHVGLVMARRTESTSSTLIEHWTIGADLRLNGDDRGWSAGIARRSAIDVHIKEEPFDKLVPEYLGFLDGEITDDARAHRTFSFFTIDDEVTPRAVWVRWESLGFDATAGDQHRGVSAGFGAGATLLADRIDWLSVIAAVRRCNGEVDVRGWRIAPDDSRVAEHDPGMDSTNQDSTER